MDYMGAQQNRAPYGSKKCVGRRRENGGGLIRDYLRTVLGSYHILTLKHHHAQAKTAMMSGCLTASQRGNGGYVQATDRSS